jgi:hypothetical protein
MRGAIPPFPQYAFMALCLAKKHRNNFMGRTNYRGCLRGRTVDDILSKRADAKEERRALRNDELRHLYLLLKLPKSMRQEILRLFQYKVHESLI